MLLLHNHPCAGVVSLPHQNNRPRSTAVVDYFVVYGRHATTIGGDLVVTDKANTTKIRVSSFVGAIAFDRPPSSFQFSIRAHVERST